MDEEDIMNATMKKRKATMNRYVSHDIIEEILSYLPCKSLLRFKVVSKQWESLLHDSRFIDKHRRRNMNQPSHFLYFDYSYFNNSKIMLHMYEIDVDGYSHAKTVKTSIPKSHEVLMRSSHGLICFHNYYNRKLVVFNPSTEHVINLPDYPEPFQSSRVFSLGGGLKIRGNMYYNNLGFGFDVKSKRYKAVQLVRNSKGNGISKCHVLTMERFESCWREINDASLDCKVEDYMLPVCVGGVIYWETKLMAPDKRICIMKFDLSCEKIKMIFGPEECKDVRFRHLVELQGNLCFADVTRTTDELVHMDIWRLNCSNDGHISWAPLYKLELGSKRFTSSHFFPLCIYGRRIILRGNGALYCYDVEEKCLKTYKGDAEDLTNALDLVHTEAIVLLD